MAMGFSLFEQTVETVAPYSPATIGIGTTETGLVKGNRPPEFVLIKTDHLAQVAFTSLAVEIVKLFEEGVGTLSFYQMSENGQ